MPSIESLITNFFADNVPSMISKHVEPVTRFGICAEFSPKSDEFTYMVGDQVTEIPDDSLLPDTLRSYIIPSGSYACVTFSANDIETLTTTALEKGYQELFGWLGSSEEWENSDNGIAYEVYKNNRFEVASWPEMGIWTPVKRKTK